MRKILMGFSKFDTMHSYLGQMAMVSYLNREKCTTAVRKNVLKIREQRISSNLRKRNSVVVYKSFRWGKYCFNFFL